MGLKNWLYRYLGKTETNSNLEFDHFREDSHAKLELVRLEDRIVLSVSAGLVGDVLELDFDAASDEATISVDNGGTTLEVNEGPTPGLPGSILQLDLSQISSILVTGTDSSQVINFLGQENLVLPGTVDLTGFTGDVNLGIEIQVDPSTPAQFNAASTVTYLGQFELTGDQLDVILPDTANSDDSFVIQINGPNLEIIDPDRATPLLFTTPAAGLTSINIFGADGETDLLKLDYNSPGLANISITFEGGTGGNDALEFFGGTFDTITHDLTGPGAGSIDLSDNGITEISYTGLEPVFGGSNTADNVVINLPTATTDAVLEDATIAGEMQIRSLSSAFELTTFASPSDSLTITMAGGNSVVTLNSFDAVFAPTNFIISGNAGDTYQLTASDLLADTVSLTLSGGATLDLGAFNETVDGFLLEDGTVIATSGILSAQSDLDLRSGSVKAQLNGTNLTKNGTGTVILDALNGYTGTTTINDGILQFAQSNAIPNTSSVNLTAVTSVLDLNGFEVSLTSLTGPGTVELGSATGVLDVNQAISTSSTFAGGISGDGSLTKSGAGEFILSGTSSFTGATDVKNGSLLVEGSLTTSEVIVVSGAVLGGSGSVVAPVTVNSGGKIAPGSSPGILSTGDLTLNSGSTLDVEITGTTAGTEYDQIQVTGTVDITGTTLNIISAFTAAAGNEFLLIDNDGTGDDVTGTFDGLAEGTFFTFNGNQVYITYMGGDGNDVVLTVNTPPSAADQLFDVDENTSNTTNIGTIIAADTDLPPDALSFTVTGGSGQTAFNVNTSGEITVADQSQLDFETTNSFELEILVTDSAGATDTATITIDINPLNDNDPVVGNPIRNVDENSINGTNVGAVIVATDDDLPGDILTFSETGGTGAAAFDITAAGQIIVADQSLLNFETNPSYTLDILVDDNAGGTTAATITINLNDLVETLVVDTADWSVNDITLIRDGSQLRVLETGTLNEIVPSHNFANVSSVSITGNAADNITRLDLSGGAITPAGGINFNGGTGSNTLVAPDQANDWNISGSNSGSLLSGTIVFSNVQNLTGNDAVDSFVMQDGGQLDGTLDGGNGTDSVDFSAITAIVNVNLDDGSATGLNLTSGIEQFIGDNTQDQLTGISAGTTYLINGINQGTVSGIGFTGFNHLIGAAGIDTFQFSGTGQITGSIDGLTGTDILDYSTSSLALDLILSATGSDNGFSGSESSTVSSFDNINTIIGSSNTDELTGINATANWSIDGSNQYTSTNTLDLSGFENLTGGTDVDTFTISGNQTHNLSGNSGNDRFLFADGASLTGNIDGQAGTDELDFSLVTTNLDVMLTALGSVDGFQGTEASISGGFDNINTIAAGTGAADNLTGINATANWSIDGSNQYTSTNTLDLSGFENLTGGTDVDAFTISGNQAHNLSGNSGNDSFQVLDGASLTGSIDGQGGTDHLNLANYTTDLSVTLTSIGTTDGFNGNESANSIGFQNIDQLTGGAGTNSLAGIDSAATWTLNGTNSYQSTNTLDFSHFFNLVGGNNTDTFDLTPDAESFNIVGGDPTSNPLGDQLNIDTSTAGTALVTYNGDSSGSVSGTFPTITYSEIENFDVTGVVDIQLVTTTGADTIEILVSGSSVEYRLGGILVGTSSLTATNDITIDSGDGDDSLTVDVALAAQGILVNYNGEGQDSTNPGDVLNLIGSSTSVEYFFADASSGSIRIDGASSDFIVYTGLEPITSTVTTTDVTLNYSGAAETITISDAGGGQTTVDSTAGEILTFNNPTGTLTINSGAGDDIIDIESLAANYTASLIINGDGNNDTINANTSLSFDTGRTIEFTTETINIANAITLTAAGIALNATEVNLDGDLVSSTVSGDATTVNVLGSTGGADIQDAVDVAGTGGTINVAAGTYITADTLDVDESVSILGAGKDTVEIRKAGDPTNNFDVAINITADNVTISGAQLGWETHTSATDYQGYVVLTRADNTTLNNLLFSDNYRSAVVFEGADNLEVSDSIFEGKFGRAAIRDGDSGSGENFLITRNEFRADHFRWGPIAIGPQGTSGSPNNFAFSGVISFNFFGNGLEAGSFQSGGDQNYTLTITNGGMTSDGVNIVHNTFDWQDSATTNSNGIFAQPGGIFFDPSLSVPIGTVNITDNIFNGFTYDGPQPSTEPLWNPTGGVFGGALEFDGVDDFGIFQDALFNVGDAGTLSFWVNMDDQGRRNQFFEGPNNGGMEFQYRSNGGGQFFGSPNRNSGNSNNYAIQDGGAGGTTGVWQNIQFTWDFDGGVSPSMHIFIDGTEADYLNSTFDSDLSQWVSTVSTVNELMNVARDPVSGRYFDGLMDDVGWFNDVLNSTELADIMNNGVAALSADARLVAHWDFDQSTGDIAVDNKNGIQMFLSTDGIVPFGPEFQTAAGQFGGALQFDGVDDFATFQDASFDVGRQGTLNFWVKMEDTGRRNQFFEGPDNGGFEFQYRTNGGGQFFGRTQNGADYTIQQGGHAGVETFWTNLQYTWDADTGEMHIYLNGAEEPYLSSFDENLAGFDSTHFTDTINGLMNVGRDPGTGDRFFEGLMDDIGWFNDVLDSTERAAIMNSGVASLAGDSRLVAHWSLDDDPGTTIVPGDSGTNIVLYIQAEPPLPPIEGFGVLAPLNANVTFNAFNDNDLNSNVTLDATNQLGDPLFAYETDPLFVATDSLEEQFTIGFGSSAAYFSSEFASDTDTTTPHIGAYQNPPTLYPGLYGKGDIVIYGTGEDDLLEITFTSENTATFVLTRDAGGPNELELETVILTEITSITFNGLGGDDVLILNQPDNDFFNPTGGVTFNGGTQNNDGNSLNPEPALNAMGDTLVINHTNAVEADSFAYVFMPDTIPAEGEDGVITITDTVISDGSTSISFTGLEEPILDNLSASNRDFDFTDATETISLSDDNNDNYADHSFIDSDLSQSVIFKNPTTSLTIRTASAGTPVGIDTVEINSLDSAFDADLTILAGDNDSITVQTDVDLKTGDLLFSAETVNIIGNIEANSVDISSSGGTSTTFNGGSVTTTDFQLYNNAVNLLQDATLTSTNGAAIEFKSTIDGANNLNLNTAGNTILEGAAGSTTALSSLTTNPSGTTAINGGSVTTTGAQTYNDAVTFGASTVFTSTTTDNISFNSSVTGGIGFSVDIISQNEVNIIGSFEADGYITATAGTDIQISSLLSSATGNITFLADNDITLNAAARVLSQTNGQIILTADNDASSSGSITMQSGSTVESQGGRIQLTADGTVALSAITTTGTVAIESKSAAITDNQDAIRDIVASSTVLKAATGIGSANALETAVSVLAALNTDSGHIQILNDLGGALLTIGTVDGLAGVTHSGSVAGDIIIANASPLTVDAPVINSSGGNIDLESTGPGDLILNASVRASGGNGNINVEAGDGILDINDTGVDSDHSIEGTGIFSGHGNSGVDFDSNTTLTSETGAIADVPPDLRNIATPQILATGDATVTGDFGRFSEQNFFITIDWGDGTVETFNFTDPGSFIFTHNYTANPNTSNPAADIPILVRIQGDKQFTFSDGTGILDFTSETGLLETPGDGLATVAIDTTPQVPLLLFPQNEIILDSTSTQSSVFTSKETQLIESAINEANKNAERLVFLRIIAPNGNIIEDVPLQESDLDNLPKLFKSLPDGRYQIYLKEAGEERIRLLMDVDIRGGKATDVTETQLKQSPSQNQPESATEKGTTQIESDSLPVLSSVENIFNTDYENIVSLIAAYIEPVDFENSLEFTEIFQTDDRININNAVIDNSSVDPATQPETATLKKAPSIDAASANLEFTEKAWSSAALLSGIYHGRPALKRPVKQSECETAMEKYGQRLLSRQYNIFKRNQ